MTDWKTERHYGKQMLVEGSQTGNLRELIRAFIDTKGETVSRLAKAAHGPASNGTDLHDFLAGRRRMGAKPAQRIVDAITNYPKGFGEGSPQPAIAQSRTAEYRMTKELNANRDAAEQRRAAHIEACRQREIEKYGYTTISRDVMEMVA